MQEKYYDNPNAPIPCCGESLEVQFYICISGRKQVRYRSALRAVYWTKY